MSRGAEKALFGLLTEQSSIETLVLEGFHSRFIPSVELRPIYDWAIHTFQISGNISPPTAVMFKETDAEGHGGKSMADVLDESDISIDEVPDESVEWVMEELRSRYLTKQTQTFTRTLTEEITSAPSADRPGIFTEHIAEGIRISLDLQTKRSVFDLGADAQDILTSYEARESNLGRFMGLRLGLPEIDAHTNGVHEGELMVIAAPPKGSKSYMIDRIALKEFKEGRSVALFTLENSIEMTRDRIACLATGVHPVRFERAECSAEEVRAVYEWVEESLTPSDAKLLIISPPRGERTIESMVSQAQIRGTESLLIDQLTFVDAIDTKASGPRQIREITHSLKEMISTGNHRMSCVMTHQITRDGIKVARKLGYLSPYDMAEGSEVEKTADWLVSMWQSDDARQVNQFLFQILACRRQDIKNWAVSWDISSGNMEVLHEADLW